MMRHNPYAAAAYKQNNVQSMSPAEQVARLLETAAKHIRRAKVHAEAQEFELRYKATEDASKIITGLSGCLNHEEAAAEMSNILEGYYTNLLLQITRINIKNCADTCDTMVNSLTEMAATWRQIEQQQNNNSTTLIQQTADNNESLNKKPESFSQRA